MVEGSEFGEHDSPLVSVEELLSPHWREKLDEYIYSDDPWRISIADLTAKFGREVEELGGKNLELSGRMVLTCAVILRAKAEGLIGSESPEEEEDFEEELDPGFWGYEEFDSENYVPKLELPLKRINKRTVTRNELSQAFTSAIEVHERREERWDEAEEELLPDWGMDFDEEENFRVKLQRLYRKVKEKLSRGKEVLFSTLLTNDTREEKFSTFMELLHLQSEGKISCKQEKPFSEIKVELDD